MIKNIFILLLIGSVGYFGFYKKETTTRSNEKNGNADTLEPLRVIIWQDMSGSIHQNGVDVIDPARDFQPIFEAGMHRKVFVWFSFIDEQSNKKPYILDLQPPQFKKRPVEPGRSGKSLVIYEKQIEEYKNRLSRYEIDSARYYAKRNSDSTQFVDKISLAIKNYKSVGSTDLNGVFDVTDGVLNERPGFYTENYAIFITDGINTGPNRLFEMKNKPVTAIVNRIPKGKEAKSVYALMDYNLTSISEALNLVNQQTQNDE